MPATTAAITTSTGTKRLAMVLPAVSSKLSGATSCVCSILRTTGAVGAAAGALGAVGVTGGGEAAGVAAGVAVGGTGVAAGVAVGLVGAGAELGALGASPVG